MRSISVTLKELIESLQKANNEQLNKKVRSIGASTDGNYVIYFEDDNDELRVPMYK